MSFYQFQELDLTTYRYVKTGAMPRGGLPWVHLQADGVKTFVAEVEAGSPRPYGGRVGAEWRAIRASPRQQAARPKAGRITPPALSRFPEALLDCHRGD